MKSIIIDDDLNGTNALKRLIEAYYPDCTTILFARTVHEAVPIIREEKPDIVFLDVEMNGEMGFDLFGYFPDPQFETIFTTAHEKYALTAIKLSCLAYLLKPIDPKELIEVFEKFKEKSEAINYAKRIEVLLAGIDATKTANQKIAIPHSKGFAVFDSKELICCQADGKYTIVFAKDGKKIVSSKNIGDFEEILNPSMFFRCHKSYIINIEEVVDFIKEGNQVVLSNEMSLDVSFRKKDDFLKLFHRF